ncbi:hypothetical protein [Silvimonas iriomotensis]|uniref:Uncharacterized protein n=1 Tax=Silvimonas iriomotensis TaxID=449662 RepID=A0ABQ2PAH9_9NEIS|nr:hypothetical protein [Silvimonas iriomotensis]GGP22045.1 hypothetical protein GCM10010970_23130 [Silvimonas iriomotensis]
MSKEQDGFNRTGQLVVWRDSVSAGDDVEAPHEVRVEIERESTLAGIVAMLVSDGYLPNISGGKASWILVSGTQTLAVLAQQWSKPEYLVPSTERIESVVDFAGRSHLQFRYWVQAEPDQILESLRNGQPLPSRY